MAEQTTIQATNTDPAAAAAATPAVDPAAVAAQTATPPVAAPVAKPTKPTSGKPDKALEARVNEELRRRLKMSPEEFTAFQAKGGIVIPQAAFKQRIQREAAKLQAAAGAQTPATGAAPAQPTNGKNAALEAAMARALKAEKNAERIQREATERERQLKKAASRAEMERIGMEIQTKALRAGVNEEDVDVAMFLFQRAVLADKSLTAEAYFASLKTTKPALFGGAQPAEPRVVRPTTAPPETAQRPPKPTPAGASAVSDNAETDTPEQFKRRQERYGFMGA